MIPAVASALLADARRTNERRLLVLAGDRDAGLRAAADVVETQEPGRAVLVGRREGPPIDRVPPERAGDLLGTTQDLVVFDAHDGLAPNAVGRTVGTVDGGGLFVLCCPPLDGWRDRRDPFDETIAVPPFDPGDVTGRLRRRFVDTLRAHPGIAVVDVDAGRIEDDGMIDPAPRLTPDAPSIPDDRAFPAEAYRACRTGDQIDALFALERLCEPGNAVVVEADRGRGKSSVAGLAAACLARDGETVVVTAPRFRAAREAFARADELLATLEDRPTADGVPRRIESAAGGEVRFEVPDAARGTEADAVVVDEAAALPVAVLAAFLDAGRVAYVTTVHGYEGAGRGFSVRFRDRLTGSDLAVTDVAMSDPIRYAAGDPVEVWAFRALLLDASPAVDPVIEGASPETVEYAALDPDSLLADEPLLGEAFGLLVLAHYRTEPDDLARLLDAPNVTARALLYDGHVASVALLAREGDLPAERRREMYEGGRIKGNMLPDVLTSQLRDERAGDPAGIRVLRIATHAAVRSRGLGSRLLAEIREEFAGDGRLAVPHPRWERTVDWIGVGFGATPDLVGFWADNGYSTVHLSTTRNETSGEHSVLMLDPLTDAGEDLHDRHAEWFADRALAMLPDALRDVDPAVVRAALRATDVAVAPGLDDRGWRLVAAMAYGPALMDVDPGPFRRLAAAHLIDPDDEEILNPRQERLLVAKALQARPWTEVANSFEFASRRQCMRAVGWAYRPLVDEYGNEAARDERDRY